MNDAAHTPPVAAADRPLHPSAAMGWLTVAILFMLYILSLTDRNIMALMVEPIKRDLALSDFQISLLQGPAFALLFCLCAIPVGMALDRYSRRLVLYLSITVWSLAAASCGLAAGFAALFASRAFVGAGESGFSTGSYSIVGDSFPPQRTALAMSVFITGGVMGAGIVFLVGGPIVAAMMKSGPAAWPLIGLLQPWQQVFLATGLPGLVMALAVFAFREPARLKRMSSGAGYREALAFMGQRRFLFVTLFIGFGLAQAATIGFQLWIPSYFVRVHGWTPGRIGPVLGITQIASASLMPAHGWIVDRLYRSGRSDAHLLWCMATVLLAIPAALVALTSANPWVTILFYGCFLTLILSTASMGPSTIQVVTPMHLRGRISALYVLASGLVALAGGPSFVGFVTDKVLGDPRQVGESLIISLFCVLLPACLLFAFGRAPMRDAQARLSQG